MKGGSRAGSWTSRDGLRHYRKDHMPGRKLGAHLFVGSSDCDTYVYKAHFRLGNTQFLGNGASMKI